MSGRSECHKAHSFRLEAEELGDVLRSLGLVLTQKEVNDLKEGFSTRAG